MNKNYRQWKDDQRNIDGIVTTTGLLSLDNVSTFKDNETSQNSETKRVNSTVHKSITNSSIDPQNILNSRLRSEVMKTRSQSNVNYTLVSKSTRNNDTYEDPKRYEDAWNHPNSTERINWRISIEDEINTMVDKNVFNLVKRDDIPSIHKTILTKCVFKRKNKFKYRERLVAFGFQQTYGIDFFDSHSPVIHDICTRLIMLLRMKESDKLILVDITKAFLESTLKEDIYIEIPKGYKDVLKAENIDNKVIKLNKEVYGLKQASQCF